VNVLAIDQGTSSTKAAVVSADGSIMGFAEARVRARPVGAGGMEQDPAELLDSVIRAGRQAVDQAGTAIGAIGLANQGETVLAWDRDTGDPLGAALSWQDRRSAGICDRLASHAPRLQAVTGLPLDPYFAAPKMVWLRENMTAAGVMTTTDAWLLHRLTGAYVTDVTTASRTLLLDLEKREWSAEAGETFGVPVDQLPAVIGCTDRVGTTAAFGGGQVPITGTAVDQQAALFGEGCRSAGEAKCTYGTGAFLLVNTGRTARWSAHGLSASVGWDDRGDVAYCLDGQVYAVGAMVQWLVDLGLLRSATDLDALAGSVPDTGGVTCVPALAGLGAPHWSAPARGVFEGLSLGTTAAHLVRAALEGIAAQVALLAQTAAADLGTGLGRLRVDGGLTRSRLLMQIQADLLQTPVEVFPSPHATLLGVAELARRGSPGYSPDGRDVAGPTGPRYEPQISPGEAAGRLAGAAAAIARAVDRVS